MRIQNLSAYEMETDAILEWCKDGWITSDEFDRRAVEYDDGLLRGQPRRMETLGFRDDDYILPSVFGNRSPGGDWVYLVQVMVDKGLVECREVGGVIQYRRST